MVKAIPWSDTMGAAVEERSRVGAAPRSEQESDLQLLQKVRAGHTPAFATLVRRHQAALLSLVGSFVSTREDAEDVVQEAFVEAYRQLDRFRGDASFRTWVGRIAIYKAMGLAKRQQLVIGDDREFEDAAQPPTNPAEAIWVRDAVHDLPEELRLPVVLRFWRDMSGREIAELLDWEQSTVWTRIYRGLEQLRRTLEGEEQR
jgi:RNA polymerase sigma-70 factor (ECF subfamily)